MCVQAQRESLQLNKTVKLELPLHLKTRPPTPPEKYIQVNLFYSAQIIAVCALGVSNGCVHVFISLSICVFVVCDVCVCVVFQAYVFIGECVVFLVYIFICLWAFVCGVSGVCVY